MVYHLDSIVAARRSNVSEAQSYVTEKLECFLAARREERITQYKRMVVLMWRVIGIGVVLVSFGKAGGYAAALQKRVGGTFAAGTVYFTGTLMLSCGIMGSTCPLEDVNVDEVLDTDRCLWRGLVAILSGICLVHAVESPHAHAAGAILCVAVMCAGRGNARRGRATTCLVLFAASLVLGNSIRFLAWGLSERGGVPLFHWAALAGAEVLAMACCLAAWLRNRRRLRRWLGRADAAATLAFYPALYGHCGILSLDLVWSGSLSASFATDSFDLARGLTDLAAGMALLQPVTVVCLAGRRVVARFVAQRLGCAEGVDKERDGAFLAAMLDSCSVMVGGVWWIHRNEYEKDMRHPPTDRRHHWQKGIIVDIQDEHFTVEAGEDTTTVPMANRDVPWEHLLIMARHALRCIEWKDFTVDIFKWHSAIGDGLTGNRSAAELSRPVRPDESIDFFISHSWNDDADAKFQEVVRNVEEFKKMTGREPTFWLDHVCIDQNNIADGLKVLPVNVMSCHAFIALCGPSYFTRLWCVWELCTVMAFTPPDEVFNRVILAGLGFGGNVFHTLSQCAKFDISTCCSYDPNEEARVKRVVNAFGQAYFNRRIQRLGDLNLSLGTQRPSVVSGSSGMSVLSSLPRAISKSSTSSLRWP